MGSLRGKLGTLLKLASLSLSMTLFQNLFDLRSPLLLSISSIFFPLFKTNLHMNSCITLNLIFLIYESLGILGFLFLVSLELISLHPNPRTPCVFHRYFIMCKYYLCFNPLTSKFYISQHIRFLETNFPYTKTPFSNPSSPSLSRIILPYPLPPISTSSSTLPLPQPSYPLPSSSLSPAPSPPPSYRHITTHNRNGTRIPHTFPD